MMRDEADDVPCTPIQITSIPSRLVKVQVVVLRKLVCSLRNPLHRYYTCSRFKVDSSLSPLVLEAGCLHGTTGHRTLFTLRVSVLGRVYLLHQMLYTALQIVIHLNALGNVIINPLCAPVLEAGHLEVYLGHRRPHSTQFAGFMKMFSLMVAC